MINPEQLSQTLAFLQSLGCHASGSGALDSSLVENLLSSLVEDGFTLKSTQTFHLRRLESSPDTSPAAMVSNLIPVAICVICAGFASGLTQGLLALDFMEMKIKSTSGTEKEKEYANKVLPIIKNHHLLLVSLMLWNASATEALPIFLNKLVPEFVSIIISVTLVLMFGEIIPASILTGPNQLQIAATLTPLVYVVLVIFFPIAYPLSLLLDRIIGHDDGVTMYSRGEIVTMMRIQHEEGMRRTLHNDIRDTMNKDEVTIIGGALTFRDMIVSRVMTFEKDIYMINIRETLSYKTVYDIFKAGYSRIPVYDKDRNDIVSLILAKDLIFVDPEDEIPLVNFIDLFGRKPIFVWHDDKLGETLATFRNERAHLALVRDVESEGEGDPFYKVVGLITLEDIIEEILGTEIEDETDFPDEDDGAGKTARDLDLARLKSLGSKMTDENLSADEIEAVVNYLQESVPQVKEIIRGDKETLSSIVRKSGVLTLKKKTPPGEKAHHDDFIFRRGKVSNSCIVILQGRVKILRGEKDEIEEISGPWTTIAAEALLAKEGTYVPDFSACLESEYVRFVRITTFTELAGHSDGHNHHQRTHNGKLGRIKSFHPNTLALPPPGQTSRVVKRRNTHNFTASGTTGSLLSDPTGSAITTSRDDSDGVLLRTRTDPEANSSRSAPLRARTRSEHVPESIPMFPPVRNAEEASDSEGGEEVLRASLLSNPYEYGVREDGERKRESSVENVLHSNSQSERAVRFSR